MKADERFITPQITSKLGCKGATMKTVSRCAPCSFSDVTWSLCSNEYSENFPTYCYQLISETLNSLINISQRLKIVSPTRLRISPAYQVQVQVEQFHKILMKKTSGRYPRRAPSR